MSFGEDNSQLKLGPQQLLLGCPVPKQAPQVAKELRKNSMKEDGQLSPPTMCS